MDKDAIVSDLMTVVDDVILELSQANATLALLMLPDALETLNPEITSDALLGTYRNIDQLKEKTSERLMEIMQQIKPQPEAA